jgi:hypothetical protein
MASKLADILQQEYKTKGLFSGTASALSKSNREKTDIRNILFGGSGLGSILGQKIFGKGYSAIDRTRKVSETSGEIDSGSSSILQQINISSLNTDRNTSFLPSMARDFSLVKKNIMQLVKLQGGRPEFFADQQAREMLYESNFKKDKTFSTKVSQVQSKNQSGNSSGLLGLIGTVGKGFAGLLAPVLKLIGFFGVAGLAISAFSRVIWRILSFLAGSKLGKALGLAALAFGASKLNTDDFSNLFNNETNSVDTNANEKPKSNDTLAKVALGTSLAGAAANKMGATQALKNRTGAAVEKTFATKTSSLVGLDGKNIDMTKKMPLEKQIEKMSKFAAKAQSKGWLTRAFYKISARFGVSIATRFGAVLAGLIAAPFTAGTSLVITGAVWASNIYLVYELYDYIFGSNGLEEQLEREDAESKKNTSPSEVSQNQSSSGMGMGGEEIMSSVGATSSNPTPQSPTSSRPTRIMGGEPMADLIRTKFKAAGFSDAQAEGAVANARAESGLDPNAFNGRGGEESVGLFQMNRKGGLGEGHSIENLKDPNYNIDLAIAAAKKANRFKSATTAEEATKAFMLEVERPKDQSLFAQAKRVAFLNKTGENLNSGSVAIASSQQSTSTPSTTTPIVNVDNSRTQMASASSGTQVSAWDNLMFENMITRVI